jgi:hypothetical protein
MIGRIMSLNQNREVIAKGPRDIIGRGRGSLARDRALLAAPVSDGSDVRADKVAKAKKLIARASYPSRKVIESTAKKIARYF